MLVWYTNNLQILVIFISHSLKYDNVFLVIKKTKTTLPSLGRLQNIYV